MSPKKKPKFLIIDGHALIHRSFHALPTTLTTHSGEVVNAVYGFSSFLLKAIKEIKPDMIALALDKKGKTFRHEQYSDYKATRVKAPDELYAQIPRVKEVAAALNIPIFEIAGCEADDVIGTLSAKIKDAEKIIATGDMDVMQLIDNNTKIYTLADGTLYNERSVQDKYGIKADQVIDYKALRGDPSDNIPGVKGIGEKTAVELLQEFKTVKNVYKNIKSKKISDRIRQLLTDNEKNALMSYELATIHRDIDFDIDAKKLVFGNFDHDTVIKLFTELEFRSLIPRLMQMEGANKKIALEAREKRNVGKFETNKKNHRYNVITDDKAFNSFLKEFKKQKFFAFDTETSGLDPFTVDLLGISISWKEDEAYFLSVRQSSFNGTKSENNTLFNYQSKTKKVEMHPWLLDLKAIFENKEIKKIGHNIKFDVKILKQFDIDTKGIDFDTMIAAYILNSGSRQYSLDALSMEWLKFEKISSTDLLGSGKDKLTYDTVPVDRLGCYACEDADYTFKLYNKLKPELKKQNLDSLFNTIEMSLMECLIDMELTGISLDKPYFSSLDKELDQDIKKTENAVWKLCGKTFNISSPKQLQEILFNDLKISSAGLAKTKTGISTGADELLKLKGKHTVIDLILQYRELTKLSSTYVKTLPELINPVTGRIHTTYNQTIAATGRLSSTDPNLQNIPIRTELGRRIRQGFIAKKGATLLSLDYSQIELRLAAHISEDPGMIKAFKNHEDIHTATAAAINQVEIKDVTKDMRRAAKAVNFGILYGQGPHGLSQSADIPYGEAQEFIANYFSAYKKVREYIDATLTNARKKGYVETLLGRKRYLPEINASNAMIRKSAERMAINMPIQGTAADMIKMAMIEINKMLAKKYTGKISMLLQVHDELIFEGEEKILRQARSEIQKIMQEVLRLKVPIEVDAKIGDNWENMKKI